MKISIYLEDYKIDTDQDSIIALTLCYSYIEDPTTIAGDYSKTINIPGTINNNKIFGQIWNIDREILETEDENKSNTGIRFNASKRTDAKIFMDNDLFKKGYVQLNNITRVNGKITYQITFYSELCNVLHTLIDSSLSALNFPGKLAHIIDTKNLEKNINNKGPIISDSNASLSDYVKYGYDNNGVMDNFNASKWLTWDSANSKFAIADIDNNGTNYDSAMIFEIPSNRVRPFIKVSSLLNQIRDDFNNNEDNNGTKIMYSDPYFFNSSNPYVTDTVLSGKLYDTENTQTNISTLSFKDFNIALNETAFIPATGEYADIEGVLDFSNLSVIPNIDIEMMLAFNGKLDSRIYRNAIKGAVYTNGRQFTCDGSIKPKFYLEKLNNNREETGERVYFDMEDYCNTRNTDNDIYLGQDKDTHNTVITPLIFETVESTPTFELAFKNCVFQENQSRITDNGYSEIYVYDKKYTNLETFVSTSATLDYSIDYNDKQGVTDYFPFRFTMSNLAPGLYKLKVNFECSANALRIRNYTDYPFGDDTLDIPITEIRMRGRFDTKNGINTLENGNRMFIFRNREPMKRFIANTLEGTVVKSTTGNNLTMNSGSGILPGSVVSFADMVDAETKQGDFLINYTKLFGLMYDTDTVNEDNTIRICTRNYYHRDYKILDWTDKIDYSQNFKQVPTSFSTKYLTLNYNDNESYYSKKYSETYDTVYAQQLIDTGYEFKKDYLPLIDNMIFKQAIPVKNEGNINGVVLGNFDKSNNERSPVDGQYSLLFWDETFAPEMTVFDDASIFHDEEIGGEDNMCFIDSSSLFFHGNQGVYYEKMNIPAPQTLKDKISTDLGYPRSNFAGYSVDVYPSSGTIFSQYWENYIRSLYDKNTQVITAFVHLTPIEILNFSFKNFVKIKDTLWHVNKITDYNPLSVKPVQVELVKVNNIDAYVNSSVKRYEYFRADFNIYTDIEAVKANELLTPVAGGIISETSAHRYSGKYLYGLQWKQSFTYVNPYNQIADIEAYYYDELGNKVDCANWMDVDTLTFECQRPLPSDVVINMKVIETGTKYYNISTELTNTVLQWEIPDEQITRAKEGDELKVKLSPTDASYKFGGCIVYQDMIDITQEVFNQNTLEIHIPAIHGNILIQAEFNDYLDVLLPWIGNEDTDVYFYTEGTINSEVFNISAGISYYGHSNEERLTVLAGDNKTGFGINTSEIFASINNVNNSIVIDNPGDMHYVELYSNAGDRMQVFNTKYNNALIIDNSKFANIMSSGVGNNAKQLQIFQDMNGYYTRLSYVQFGNGNQRITNRYLPIMHYEDELGYVPCLKDVYNDTIIFGDNGNDYEIDLNSHDDIPLQWIGSNNCYFNTGEYFELGIALEMYCYSNVQYVGRLFGSNTDTFEVDDEGRHAKITNEVTCDSLGNLSTTIGVYNNGSIEFPSYDNNVIKYGKFTNGQFLRVSLKPNKLNIYSVFVNNYSKSGDFNEVVSVGDNPILIFGNGESGLRMFSFTILDTNNTVVNSFTPVLHFTGTKKEYQSSEGYSIPLGYEPCLYDMISGKYVFAQGRCETFGFKHDS